MNETEQTVKPVKLEDGRLWSLDAMRGLDMLMITGLAGILISLCNCIGFGGEWMAQQMRHVPWHGVHIMDTMFPIFLFISGVSFPYALAKQRERGWSTKRIVGKCVYRAFMLAFLGLVVSGFLKFQFAHLRVWSVLGRIGFAWMFAAFLYMAFRRPTRLAAAAAILIGSWLFFRFVPAPDALTVAYPAKLKHLAFLGNGPFTPAGDFGCWLDRTLTHGHTCRALFDPEGFSGLLPAIVTAMLGMFAGELVKDGKWSGNVKTLIMLAVGLALGFLGWAADAAGICPINKALWSPSFVLYVGGWSFLVFALFYWVVDVKRYRRWTFFLRVVGMNSITIYVAKCIIPFQSVKAALFTGVIGFFSGPWESLVNGLCYMFTCWLFLYFLYRKNVFLKV